MTNPNSIVPSQPSAIETTQKAMVQPNEPVMRVLPRVQVPGGSTTISTSAMCLFRAIAPHRHMFYRGGLVVEVVNDGPDYNVEVLEAVAAQSRFEKYVQFEKLKSIRDVFTYEPTTINKATAEQYLASAEAKKYLPSFSGLLACPLMIERDGQLHALQTGYDAITGYYVTTGRGVEEPPLEDAVDFLTSILNEFDFATQGDRSRAIASLITPALKLGGFIKSSIPVDVAEADQSQAGKTYRQKVIAAIYRQKPAVVTKRKGGVGSMEETFGDHLAKGKVFIQFDNIRGDLDSQFLEAFVTASGKVSVRTPYRANVEVETAKHILFITSNGFVATKDMANRSSIIRIRKREGHQFRLFDGMELLEFVDNVQPAILGAVFTVIREWYRQGKPRTQETRHDFREWCQTLDWIVQNIFEAAPLMDGHNEAKERSHNPRLTFIRAVILKLEEQGKLGQPVSATEITELCIEEGIMMPGLSAEKHTDTEGKKHLGRILKKLFQDDDRFELEGYTGEREQIAEETFNGNRQVTYRYRFSRTDALDRERS